jgi:hypothetical protein
MGFGPSDLASNETRRAYFEAGLSPLGTQNRERFTAGAGISPLATRAEKDSWIAAEVQAGLRPESQLPKRFGGIGERPKTPKTAFNASGEETAYGRRMRRMQEDWDKQQQEARQQMEFAEKMDLEAGREARLQEESERERVLEAMEADRASTVSAQAKAIQEGIMGGKIIGEKDGSPIFSEPIMPTDPEAIQKINNLTKDNFLGTENPIIQKMVERVTNDALKYQEILRQDSEKELEQSQRFLIEQQKEASSLGVDTSPFFVQDKQTGDIKSVDQLGLSKAIGEAKKADVERKNQEIKSSKIDEDISKEARSIVEKIEESDKLIREANFKAQKETNPRLRDEHLSNAEFLRNERALLEQRYNNLLPNKPSEQPAQPSGSQAQAEIMKFNSIEEAESANLPSGTIIEIGGRRARID